jgi:cyclopropane fatty-acyl-phospholipid synthase-like methyltransferase
MTLTLNSELHAEKMRYYSSLYKAQKKDTIEHFVYHFTEQFKGIDFTDKNVLEIGCGKGFISLYIGYFLNPKQIDALDESMGEGSDIKDLDTLQTNIDMLKIKNISIVKKDIMQHERFGTYDIVISNNAMHHVCEHGLLKWDTRAKKKYIEIFKHVKSLIKPNGFLLMHEYSRYSLWRFLPSKKFKGIEWSLHPTKAEWINVLRNAEFTKDITCEYVSPYKLRNISFIIKNPIVMFFYFPNFFLRARN